MGEQIKVKYTSENGAFTSTAYVDDETLIGTDKYTDVRVELEVRYIDTNRDNT